MPKLVTIGSLLLLSGVVACGDANTGFLTGAAPSTAGGGAGGAAGAPAGAGGASGGGGGGGASAGSGSAGGATSDAGNADAGAGGGPVGGGGDGGGSFPPPASSPPPPPAGAGIPCDVAAVLAAKCVDCHADPPVNGSLSGLVTLADLMATAKEDPTKNEAQLSLARMQSTSSPMPPASVGNPVTTTEVQAFQTWIGASFQGSCADAGAPVPPSDVFTGAPGFVSTVGASSHNAGQDCMNGCHDHGFTFAGTLTDGAGKGVAGAEVRLVDANGKAISVHTGPNGNFHSSTTFTGPSNVGARDASNKALMVATIQPANGGCNGCHANGGTTAPIHLP